MTRWLHSNSLYYQYHLGFARTSHTGICTQTIMLVPQYPKCLNPLLCEIILSMRNIRFNDVGAGRLT